MMRVVVDGIIYGRQRFGGINTYFNEVLPRIARYDDTHVRLLLPQQHLGDYPGPPVRTIARDILPSRTGLSWRLDQALEPILESLKLGLLGLWVKGKEKTVFPPSYFTSLPLRIPHVATAYDMNHELFPNNYNDPHGTWLRRRYPEYLRSATRIIAISETTKAHVERFYGLRPQVIDVVHLAVDRAKFYEDTRADQLRRLTEQFDISQPYVLYVGGRWHYKNFPIVLQAISKIHPGMGLKVVVAGPPWDLRESSEVLSHPAAAALRLVPHPGDDLLRTLYSFATAFVFPSLHEGFGIPLLEAMSCGTPVIASDTGIFREVAGSAAMFFDPGDAEALGQALERSLDGRTREEYRARGLEQVARYSWDRTAAATHDTYRRALDV